MPVMVMNADEVAARLGLTPQTVRSYLKNGMLRGFQVAGKWRITEAAFDAFVLGLEESGAPSNNGPLAQRKATERKRRTA